MHIPFLSRPRSANIPAWTPLVAGFFLVLVIGASAGLAFMNKSRSTEASLKGLEAALAAGDAERVLAYLDLDALAGNVLRRVYSNRPGSEARGITEAPRAAALFRTIIIKAVTERAVDDAPEDSILGNLRGISGRRVTVTGGDSAYVDLDGGDRFMLRREGARWVITDYVGFESRLDAYARQARQLMEGKAPRAADGEQRP